MSIGKLHGCPALTDAMYPLGASRCSWSRAPTCVVVNLALRWVWRHGLVRFWVDPWMARLVKVRLSWLWWGVNGCRQHWALIEEPSTGSWTFRHRCEPSIVEGTDNIHHVIHYLYPYQSDQVHFATYSLCKAFHLRSIFSMRAIDGKKWSAANWIGYLT